LEGPDRRKRGREDAYGQGCMKEVAVDLSFAAKKEK